MTARAASFALAAVLFLAGCAQAPKAPERAADNTWSGRLALQVENAPSQSFSALFELRGEPSAGELTLNTPLGGTIAVLSWAPGSATLKTGGETRQFPSVEALAAQATGTSLPLAALFDWLRGANTPVPGWQVDLSQVAQGRLQARRVEPPPVAELRVAIDR